MGDFPWYWLGFSNITWLYKSNITKSIDEILQPLPGLSCSCNQQQCDHCNEDQVSPGHVQVQVGTDILGKGLVHLAQHCLDVSLRVPTQTDSAGPCTSPSPVISLSTQTQRWLGDTWSLHVVIYCMNMKILAMAAEMSKC